MVPPEFLNAYCAPCPSDIETDPDAIYVNLKWIDPYYTNLVPFGCIVAYEIQMISDMLSDEFLERKFVDNGNEQTYFYVPSQKPGHLGPVTFRIRSIAERSFQFEPSKPVGNWVYFSGSYSQEICCGSSSSSSSSSASSSSSSASSSSSSDSSSSSSDSSSSSSDSSSSSQGPSSSSSSSSSQSSSSSSEVVCPQDMITCPGYSNPVARDPKNNCDCPPPPSSSSSSSVIFSSSSSSSSSFLETFNMLTEVSDNILTEDGSIIVWRR